MAVKVAILGAGSWGTALAVLLGKGMCAVYLWGREESQIVALQSERTNARYLPGIPFPDTVTPVTSLEDACREAEFVIVAVPSGAVRAVMQEAAAFLRGDAIVVSAAKGLEEETGLRMSQVMAEVLPGIADRLVVLSGPNLALEVARGMPTASVAASADPAAAKAVQQLFASLPAPTFRVYTGSDVIGVELGGAIKNVIAIAAGVCDGLGYGDNSKAGLMTRGLTETIRLGVAQGAEASTFLGLSGVGDLIATGASGLSRNYRVGVALGKGRALPEIIAELGQVAEGVPTTRVVCDLAARSGVEMPLCNALHAALFEGRSAPDLIRELMLRPPKGE